MNRELANHRVGVCNESLRIEALEGVSTYMLSGFGRDVVLQFQRGLIKDAGINGITNEALLAIIIDRLTAFQQGDNPCKENDIALWQLSRALDTLKSRTQFRVACGLEEEKHETDPIPASQLHVG